MDTARITAPIVDRIPTAGASNMMATITDATTGLAGQIGNQAGQLGEHVGDIDVAATVRRGRRLVARIIPWVSPPRARTPRTWVLVAVAAAVVTGVVIVMRRRSSGDAAPARDDWTTSNSTNGASSNAEALREPAASNA